MSRAHSGRLLLTTALCYIVAQQPLYARAPANMTKTPDWKEIEKLIDDQKFDSALQGAEARLAAARNTANEEEWARSLIKVVQLRIGLHGYETAVRFLREQPWPKGAMFRAIIELFYAQALVTYVNAYSWEIQQRERVEAKGPVDLKAWTQEQIYEEAQRAYREVWSIREQLGHTPIASLSEYIQANDYPRGIRDTLRDAVTYLWVELLADTTGWRPEQSNELFRLDLKELIRGNAAASKKIKLDDPAVHPLVRIAAILDDLEAWHTAAHRREAALEARLARLRRLRASFTQRDEQKAIEADLETRLPGFRDVPWWSSGQALLAEMIRDAGDWPKARDVAKAGASAYPRSIGGQQCLSIQKYIEAPEFELAAMATDGIGKRSVEVTHRNLRALYFRAYAIDLEKQIASGRDYNLLPNERFMRNQIASGKPVLNWSVELPETPDFQKHRTFATPAMKQPGAYVVMASASSAWDSAQSPIRGVTMIVSELALIVRQQTDGSSEVTVLSGETGRPVMGAEVDLYQSDWQRGHHSVARSTTDAHGLVTFNFEQSRTRGFYFLIAKKGNQIALHANNVRFFRPSPTTPHRASLIYTDRSVYRPLQKVFWKVIVYQGSRGEERFQTAPKTGVSVSLIDPNGQMVETKPVMTNDFGSAAGEFTIPSGRLLGRWTISTNPVAGYSPISVEEYKRPTFEVALKDPKVALRLNKLVALVGEAKYYFGLPVADGGVKWLVRRVPEYPWWWDWWYGPRRTGGSQVVATGVARLSDSGTFEIRFTPEADEKNGSASKGITYNYSVEAEVTDEGGETRSATRSFRLGFVAVQAQIEMSTAFVREGTAGELTIRLSDLDGNGRAGHAAWRLLELKQPAHALLPADRSLPEPEKDQESRRRTMTPGDRLRPRWSRDYSPESVMSQWPDGTERSHGTLEHDAKGVGLLHLPRLTAGAYRLRYQTTDTYGEKYEAFKDFLVAGSNGSTALAAGLWAEKSSVKAGERARILALSGLPNQPMVFEVYRAGKRLDRRFLTSGKDATLIEIPIRDEDRGGLSVSLTLVHDYQPIVLTQAIFVPWDDKELQLQFTSFRDRMRPRSKETWRISVKGANGKKVEAGTAELLAYMYDQALDLFAPHAPPSVLSLYPNRSSPAYTDNSLGQAPAYWLSQSAFPSLPPYPTLSGDHLKMLDRYGIGGMGRGALGVRADAMMAPGRVPAAPPAEAESKTGIKKEAAREEAALKDGAPKPSANVPAVELRKDFSETAFWKPQLLLGSDGTSAIEFTVPDSVTSWNVWVHAITRDLRGGSLHAQAKSVKDLMVRPYVPRFLRESDQATLKVVVNNASDKPFSAKVSLDILDPETQTSLLSSFSLPAEELAPKPVSVAGGKSANLSFHLTAPKKVGTVAFKVIATAGDLSDGEVRPIPILPGRLHLMQSRFVTLRDGDKRTMSFSDLAKNDDPTRITDQLVVTVDAQLFYSVLQSLPYLINYPYECTEQTLNRFLSTGIVSTLYQQYPAVAKMAEKLSKRETPLATWDSADPNRKMTLEETPWLQSAQGGKDIGEGMVNVLNPRAAAAEREVAIAKLRKAQTSNGGFPWWPGGPPSPFMTLYLAHGFARAAEFGIEIPKDMVQRAWVYLGSHLQEHLQQWIRDDCCWEFLTFLNYVASSYPDPTYVGDALKSEQRQQILEMSYKHWRQHSPYLKSYLALTLHRMGRHADALKVFDSVMDSSKTTPDEGTFWAPEDRSWLWYNDTIETQAFALRTLMELRPNDARRHGLVQWLLLNKKLNHWKSTRATAEVIYSLVKYLKKEGALGVGEEVAVSAGAKSQRFAFEPDEYTGQKNQLVILGQEVDPKTSSAIQVEKSGKGFAFASATWSFSTDRLASEERGDFFSISRRYFRRVKSGREAVLKPLAEGNPIAPGDEVEVQISIRSKHMAEYVHLRDPRAAGLEPEAATSKYKWDLGIGWYEEIRDSGTNFFFEQLPAGEYTFKYRLRANMAGRFRIGPATLQSMYAPEFNAYSSGYTLDVTSQ